MAVLEREFAFSRTFQRDTRRRKGLAVKLGVQEKQIDTWFRNRRAKQNRKDTAKFEATKTFSEQPFIQQHITNAACNGGIWMNTQYFYKLLQNACSPGVPDGIIPLVVQEYEDSHARYNNPPFHSDLINSLDVSLDVEELVKEFYNPRTDVADLLSDVEVEEFLKDFHHIH